jgi:hypothetical protein
MFGESAASQELHLVSNADAVVDASKSSFVIKLEQCCPHKGQTLQLHLTQHALSPVTRHGHRRALNASSVLLQLTISFARAYNAPHTAES